MLGQAVKPFTDQQDHSDLFLGMLLLQTVCEIGEAGLFWGVFFLSFKTMSIWYLCVNMACDHSGLGGQKRASDAWGYRWR